MASCTERLVPYLQNHCSGPIAPDSLSGFTHLMPSQNTELTTLFSAQVRLFGLNQNCLLSFQLLRNTVSCLGNDASSPEMLTRLDVSEHAQMCSNSVWEGWNLLPHRRPGVSSTTLRSVHLSALNGSITSPEAEVNRPSLMNKRPDVTSFLL